MKYLKLVLPAILLALSANVSASTVNLTNNGSYTSDASTSLDWIRWDTTKNQSYNYVSSQFGTGGLYEGWQYASATQAEQFLGNFGLNSYSKWFPSSISSQSWASLTSYMGFDTSLGYNAMQAMVASTSGVSNTNVYSHWWNTGSYYNKLIVRSTIDAYSFLGSFLVRDTVVAPSPVPVPAAAWLFGSALLGFFGFSRRKANA